MKAKVSKTSCLSFRYNSILVLYFALAALISAQENHIRFEHISSEQGLSQSVVYCILQDRKGAMWFGTPDGLFRFDGYSFEEFRNKQKDSSSLPANIVPVIYEDSLGNLWIGTWDGGLSRFDREEETFVHLPYLNSLDPNPGPDVNDILTIHEDSSGAIWVGTWGGLLRFDPKKLIWNRFVHKPGIPGTLSNSRIRSFCQDHSGIMWIGTEGGGLNRFNPKTGEFSYFLHRPNDEDSLSNNRVYAILEDSNGNLWVGTMGGGLDRLDRKTNRFIHYRHHPEKPGSLSGNIIRTIFEDSKGTLWIGTTKGGLNKLKTLSEGTFVHYLHQPNNPHSLSNNIVRCIMEDDSGCIWIGTFGGGINRIDPKLQQFVHITGSPNNWSRNNVSCLVEDKHGILWIGTFGNGLNWYNPGTEKSGFYKHSSIDPGSLSSDDVETIYEDKEGGLWFGTLRGGINRLNRDTGTFTHNKYIPGSNKGPSSNNVYYFCEDQDKNLWIATREGLNLFRPGKNDFVYYKNEPRNPKSISGNRVTFIHPDREHEEILWVGIYNRGIDRFNRYTGNFEHYPHDPDNSNSLSHDWVHSIYISPHSPEILWVGTFGGGLNQFNKKTKQWNVYTVEDGLSNNSIYGILEDKNRNLWMSTNKGLSRFNPETGEFTNYYVEDGLQDNEFNGGAFLKGRDGRLYFGGINGYNVFIPEKIEKNSYIPPVVITDFKVLNRDFPLEKSILAKEKITLSYKDVFTFKFAALNYTATAKNRYAYKLEGLKDKWIQLNHKRDITFTALSPGEYVFRVKGSNNDGVWNEDGTSIKIIITSPFYSTWWFRVIVFLLLIFSLYLWHQSRMKRLRLTLRLKTEKEMERIVEKYNISAREQEILNLIMKGKSNKEIEDTLFISMPTVKTHISNIYKKFTVKKRLELIRLIQQSIGAE